VPLTTGAAVTTWSTVAGRRVRAVEVVPAEQSWGQVCVLPGLSLTGYVLPTARALASRGLRCAVLDLPGLGRGARAVAPQPVRVGDLAAAWISGQPDTGPVVVLGHSTGVAPAIRAATALPVPPALLALAGPVFTPSQRRLPRLVAVTPRAYTRESPGELVPAARLAAHLPRVAAIVRAGLRVRPEDLVGEVTSPILLTAGEADAYAPEEWLALLARSARSAETVHCTRLPGSHNNLYTHPDELADLLVRAVAGRSARGDRPREV
jgi:pimeloyl-ACP methyl ester carboxylesterase